MHDKPRNLSAIIAWQFEFVGTGQGGITGGKAAGATRVDRLTGGDIPWFLRRVELLTISEYGFWKFRGGFFRWRQMAMEELTVNKLVREADQVLVNLRWANSCAPTTLEAAWLMRRVRMFAGTTPFRYSCPPVPPSIRRLSKIGPVCVCPALGDSTTTPCGCAQTVVACRR